ncbi:hypothetical protein [Bradyrhizobium sp. URHA0013]|uniref:hypothetical protein n=1 Tax=Bradyrhizobium sp. URHA0013 TaxID=1380352 RepID=UPI001AEC4FB2|nr:hypothetical protein [Bradyrhizobium sp. URHA0013]
MPRMWRGQLRGNEQTDENTEGRNSTSLPEHPREQPPRRPGGQPPWIVGPAIFKEGREREAGTTTQEKSAATHVDPDFRRLTRFVGSEGDQIASENSVQPTGEEKPRRTPGTPLPDDYLDIPEFLRRPPNPEPAKLDKKLTDLPSASFGGGNIYGGNRGSGGGGRKSDEECRKEWSRAQEICRDAFANGTIGDIFKRWKSNYPAGPVPKSSNEPWDVNDCKPGFVTEDCGGNDYERPPPPEERKEIGRRLVRQKKEKSAKEKAKRNEIYEEFKRTGKWRFRG